MGGSSWGRGLTFTQKLCPRGYLLGCLTHSGNGFHSGIHGTSFSCLRWFVRQLNECLVQPSPDNIVPQTAHDRRLVEISAIDTKGDSTEGFADGTEDIAHPRKRPHAGFGISPSPIAVTLRWR